MSGLIFLVALALCLWACLWLASFIGNQLPNPAWRNSVKVGVLVVLLAAPFADEVIGMYQFNALCKANGVESADVSKARGKRVMVHDAYFAWQSISSGTILPMDETETLLRDAETNEVLARFKNYRSRGGWLMRYTPLNMGGSGPMLFGGSACDWAAITASMNRNDITWIKN